jgi:hypothetical protein
MQKDFITATPDSGGSGSTTVTATAPANQTESVRSVNLSVAGGGMTRTVGASQAAGVVTWNYYFSVTPTSLSFVAGGGTKAVTVTSYRKKVINGVETSTQENVNWTPTVSGTGFSVSGSNVTASANSATTTRSGTATYTQAGSGKTQAVSLSQEAEAWSISSTNINISGYGSGSGTVTVTAPASGSWSIDFASNAFSLNASPASGTGSKTVTINAINDSGQTGMHNINIYLKSGGSTKDTGNIRVRITSRS